MAQTIEERFKLRCNLRLLNQHLNFSNMASGDLCNVLRPSLPILAAAALLYDFGVYVVLPLVQLGHVKGKLGAIIAVAITVDAAIFIKACNADNGDVVRLILIQFDTVDSIIETVIVRTESLQHIPYNAVLFVVCKGNFRLYTSRNTNRQDDVTVLFALALAHDTAYGLDNIYNRFARVEEHNCIQRRNIHTFRQATGIGKNTASVFPCVLLQPVDAVLAFKGIGFAVNVLQFNGLVVAITGVDFVQCLDFLEHRHKLFALVDGLGKSNSAAHRLRVVGKIVILTGEMGLFGKTIHAAYNLDGIIEG